VVVGSRNWFTRIYGQSADYLQIRRWPLESGRMFDEEDVARDNQVAVVGQTIVEELFQGTDPIGETIRVHGLPLTVIGVLAPKGMSLMGSVQDDIIIVPYSTSFQKISGRSHAMVINVQVYDTAAMETAREKIADLLRERHRLGPDQEDDFTIQTQQEVAETATATSRIMTILLAAIAGVSMLVGGIGIMNIMLVSVTERTREIGLRMALGAHGKHILLQFLVESVLLSVIGGALGVLIAAAATRIITHQAGWPALLSREAILFAFTISIAIGVAFGFFPAFKASRLDPIDALRHE